MEEKETNLSLEIGNLNDLAGNAVVYWNVSPSDNNKNKDIINILAVNFVISVFPFDDNLVTATFPPVGFEDREEFMLYIKQSQCDLIYAGEISLDNDIEDFKNLPDKEYYVLNRILNEYMEFYREKVDNVISNLSLKEKIYLLKKLITNFRNVLKTKNRNIKIPINMNRIRRLILDLKKHFNPFDLENFNSIVPIKGETADILVNLYFEKFISIYYEDYEKASQVTSEIEKYQQKLDAK